MLTELRRSVLAGDPLGASSPEITAAFALSVEAVHTHQKLLFTRFDVPDLPQIRRRAELVRRAIAVGTVRR